MRNICEIMITTRPSTSIGGVGVDTFTLINV